MTATTGCSHPTFSSGSQLLYLTACLELLLLLLFVGLLHLEPSRCNSPSDLIWSSVRHPGRRGPSGGPWSIHTRAHAHTWVRRGCFEYWGSSVHRNEEDKVLWFISFMPPPPYFPLHLLPCHILHTNPWHIVTLTWTDLWPSSPKLASCSCFETRREDRAAFDGWAGSWSWGADGRWEDRHMNDAACWEPPAGNYANELETRDWFDLRGGRKWDGFSDSGRNEEVSQLLFLIHENFWPKVSTREHERSHKINTRPILFPPCASAHVKVVWSWRSYLRTDCRWNGRRLMDLFRAIRSEWSPSQVRLPQLC